MSRQNTWFTFTSPDMWLGEFDLPADDSRWATTNTIDDRGPVIAFPRTTVRIEQEGHASVVSDPMRAVLYRAGQPYRREVVSAEGDRCSFISFSRSLAAEAAGVFDSTADDPWTYRFPFPVAQLGAADYRLHQLVRMRLAAGDAADDEVREALYHLLWRVVASGYGAASIPEQRRPQTAAGHVAAVEEVRASLGRDLAVTAPLDELAASVHLSPFHLARVFREGTGRSIHGYRTEVRLRASLGQIADGARLADVAANLGFASQAHFTDRFRRAFGIAPSAWRQMRRNVEAIGGRARLA